MAITTLDLALAGMQPPKFYSKGVTPTLVIGRFHSMWYIAGIPGAGSANTTNATGVVRSNTSAYVAGAIPYTDPGSGNGYLARFTSVAPQGSVLLCDRLWDCGANSAAGALSPTATTAQTINSATWPARDATGTTNGVGVQIALEVSTILGAGAPTTASNISYTNSSGTASRTGNLVQPMVATAAVGAFHPFGFQAGDLGVQSVQTVTMQATQTSGQWNLVAYRILSQVEIGVAGIGNSVDLLTSGFPQLYNGVVPFIVINPAATTAGPVLGTFVATQG